MKSCLNALSAFLAAACAFLFVFFATLTLIVFVGERVVFTPATYKQVLVNQHVYDRLPSLIAEQIIFQEQHSTSSQPVSVELKRLTQADWEIMLSDILTPAALRIQAESLIDQFFTYVDTPGTPLVLKVSLVDFKRQLDGEPGFNAVMHIINLQPVCTAEEWASIINSAETAQFENIPFCRPPEEVLIAAEPYIREALHLVVATFPDETYLNPKESSAADTTTANDGRITLQRTRRYIWISLCLPAFLYLLIALFGIRSFTSGGLWLGTPLVFTGFFSFVAALFIWRLPAWLIARNAPNGQVTIENLAPGLTQTVVDVGNSVVHSAARIIGIVGVVLVVVGAGMVIAGVLFGLATYRS